VIGRKKEIKPKWRILLQLWLKRAAATFQSLDAKWQNHHEKNSMKAQPKSSVPGARKCTGNTSTEGVQVGAVQFGSACSCSQGILKRGLPPQKPLTSFNHKFLLSPNKMYCEFSQCISTCLYPTNIPFSDLETQTPHWRKCPVSLLPPTISQKDILGWLICFCFQFTFWSLLNVWLLVGSQTCEWYWIVCCFLILQAYFAESSL
jgi:hypothetical protein